ncbi:RE63021p [Strongyloides ratti]|uniref:RE63021p n=1 Tax=Strongyloides ratti TaxID=34506 RepID=A0A090KQC5_STRRB|nr:RE63021p [Strongyloides ratti]CEF59703.1 RE63021p [Strongyloides ratti]
MSKIRIAVLGQAGVGKSTLINTFIKKDNKEYEPTIEEIINVELNINKKKFTINVLDTSGVELFYGQRKLYFNESDAFILVYSVTDPKSFYYIINIYKNILSLHTMKMNGICRPILLVGMKSDIIKERKISTNEGKIIASNLGISFIETNKFDQSSIIDAFINIINQNIYFKLFEETKFIHVNSLFGNKIKISDKRNKKTCNIM